MTTATLSLAGLLDDERALIAKISAFPKGYEPQDAVERGLLEWMLVLHVVYSTNLPDGRRVFRPIIQVPEEALAA